MQVSSTTLVFQVSLFGWAIHLRWRELCAPQFVFSSLYIERIPVISVTSKNHVLAVSPVHF